MRALVYKDLKQVRSNRMVWLPMLVVPAMLLVVFPTVIVLLPSLAGPEQFDASDLDGFLKRFPPELLRGDDTSDLRKLWVVLGANYLFAPIFLIVPLMISSILGADSFAGEKERKTLEALLYTPITDTELFVAKLCTALIPALVANLALFILYGILVNAMGYHVVGRIFFPSATWWPLVFWLGPGVAVAGLGGTVLMSSKAKTFMEAQQVSGLLVLPIVFLMIGQFSGLFFLGAAIILLVGVLVWGIGLWLIWVGAKTFARGELIARI